MENPPPPKDNKDQDKNKDQQKDNKDQKDDKNQQKNNDPMAGKEVPYTMNLKIADNDHHSLEMWGPGPDGKNVKWMELQYTRAK